MPRVRELDLGALEGVGGALRGSIPAVQEGVQDHLPRPRAHREIDHREEMFLVAVDAARRQQPQDMERLPATRRARRRVEERPVVEEGTVLDGARDAGEVLHHQPPGTDVHMPDLGVPHLLVGQADIGPRAADQGVGIERPEIVPDRFIGAVDRVVFNVVAVPPAVQHDEDERPVGDRHPDPVPGPLAWLSLHQPNDMGTRRTVLCLGVGLTGELTGRLAGGQGR